MNSEERWRLLLTAKQMYSNNSSRRKAGGGRIIYGKEASSLQSGLGSRNSGMEKVSKGVTKGGSTVP
jgi:hypothetical protein